MASELKRVLQNGQLLVTTNGALVDLPKRTGKYLAYLNVTAINGATTLDVKLQHTPDKVNFYDLGSAFAQLVGVTGNESVAIPADAYQFVRMVATLAGATQDATFVCELYFDEE